MSLLTGRARAPVALSRLWTITGLFVIVVAWAYAQTLSLLPDSLWHPLWVEASKALQFPAGGRVSVDPEMTRSAIMRLLTYAAVFWLAVQLGRDRGRAREMLVVIACGATLYAIYGLFLHFAGLNYILWYRRWAYPGDVTATFVNRNAYGAYAGLGLLAAIALVVRALRVRRGSSPRRATDWAETLLLGAAPFLVAALIIGTALLLSHSRAAFLSTGAALIVLMVAVAAARILSVRAVLALGLLVAALGFGVLAVSGDGTLTRLSETPAVIADDPRGDLYRLSETAIADAPWTGFGLGTFRPAFRIYRDASLAVPLVWDFAHEIYLEMGMDLGLPAAAIFYLCLTLVLGTCVKGVLRRRRDQIYPAVALAAAALIGGHGLVDFSAQMPAIAVTLALFLGVGFAQSWSTEDDGAS